MQINEVPISLRSEMFSKMSYIYTYTRMFLIPKYLLEFFRLSIQILIDMSALIYISGIVVRLK
jgi:hypothetical protein